MLGGPPKGALLGWLAAGVSTASVVERLSAPLFHQLREAPVQVSCSAVIQRCIHVSRLVLLGYELGQRELKITNHLVSEKVLGTAFQSPQNHAARPRPSARKVSPRGAHSLASADPGRATVLPPPRSSADSAPQNRLGEVAPPVGGVPNVRTSEGAPLGIM